MACGAPWALGTACIGRGGNAASRRDSTRVRCELALLLALPLLLRLHTLGLDELVDVLDDDALQHAEGIVRSRRRPQRRLGQLRRFYLAPVQARIHGLSLLERDFGLDLQLDLVLLRLPLQLAADVVLVELRLEVGQGHAL